MHFIHSMVLGTGNPAIFIDLDNTILEYFVVAAAFILTVVLVVLAVFTAAAIATAVATAAATAAGVAAEGATLASIIGSKAVVGLIITTSVAAVGTGAKTGLVAASLVDSNWFGEEAVLTNYQITPEEIFSGKIALLNVNFFSDEPVTENTKTSDQEIQSYKFLNYIISEDTKKEINSKLKELGCNDSVDYDNIISKNKELGEVKVLSWSNNNEEYNLKYSVTGTASQGTQTSLQTSTFTINKVKTEQVEVKSIAQQVKSTIAKWYYILRNMAIVLMIPILIFIGIKILFASVASEKSKYKNMLEDWLVAFCLIFLMQYIMVFSMNLVESFTKLVGNMVQEHVYTVCITDKDGKIKKALKENNLYDAQMEDDDGNIIWNSGNLMGLIRTQAAVENVKETNSYLYIGYALAFVILVWYTIFFVYTYLKRIIYLAFLTVIAPLVAMTYPIDKINDGKAQAFDMWFKEYIFNLLIQPLHLILYTMLVSMAFDLASKNIVYTLVVLGFMMPAENLLRKFFGFEKAQTPGALGGAAGAAVFMNGMNHLFRKPPHKNPGGGASDRIFNEEKKSENNSILRDTTGIDNSKMLTDDEGERRESMVLGPEEENDDFDVRKILKGTENHNIVNDEQSPASPSNIILGGNKNNMNYDNLTADEIAIMSRLKNLDIPSIGEDSDASEDKGTNLNDNNSIKSNLRFNPTRSNPSKQINPRRNNNNKTKKSRQVISGIKAVGRDYARQKYRGALKNIWSENRIRNIGDKIIGGTVGGAAGLTSFTLGIASGGGVPKTSQYTAAAATGGYMAATASSKNHSKELDVDSIQKEFDKGFHGDDVEGHRKAQLEKERKEFMENDKKIRELREKMKCETDEETRNLLEKHKKILNAGFTDTSDIASIIKMSEDSGMSDEKAMTIAKFANKFDAKIDSGSISEKESKDFDFKVKNIVKSNNPNADDKEIEQSRERIKKYVNNYKNIKDGIDEVDMSNYNAEDEE